MKKPVPLGVSHTALNMVLMSCVSIVGELIAYWYKDTQLMAYFGILKEIIFKYAEIYPQDSSMYTSNKINTINFASETKTTIIT